MKSKFYAAQGEVRNKNYWEWLNFTDEVQKKTIKNNCDKWQKATSAAYIAENMCYFLIIVGSGTWLKHTNKTRFHLNHKYHSKMVNKYMCWISLSLLIKFCQVNTMFSNDVLVLALQPLSDLLVVSLFSIFKEDEDCFVCFNKSETISHFSIFQIPAAHLPFRNLSDKSSSVHRSISNYSDMVIMESKKTPAIAGKVAGVEVIKLSPKLANRKTIDTWKTLRNSNGNIKSTSYPESSKKSSKLSKIRSKSRFTIFSGPQDIKSVIKTQRDQSLGIS